MSLIFQENKINTLVLDFDGTLYSKDRDASIDNIWLPVHRRLMKVLLEEKGKDSSDDRVMVEVLKYRKRALEIGYTRAHEEMGGDKDLFHDLAHGADRASHLSFDQKLQDLFRNLSNNVDILIFTGAYQKSVRAGLSKLIGDGYKKMIIGILGTDDLDGYSKPDIRSYRDLIERFQIADPSKVLMVDDQVEEIKSAKEVGFKTIIVGNKSSEKQRSFADAHIDNIYDVISILTPR